ncbi:hypothetical protein AF41_04200 [Citrobacter sp. MGH 55]|nr:hypothetical protein AF41_04200 [Citrobacter sp. MGH 55]
MAITSDSQPVKFNQLVVVILNIKNQFAVRRCQIADTYLT